MKIFKMRYYVIRARIEDREIITEAPYYISGKTRRGALSGFVARVKWKYGDHVLVVITQINQIEKPFFK